MPIQEPQKIELETGIHLLIGSEYLHSKFYPFDTPNATEFGEHILAINRLIGERKILFLVDFTECGNTLNLEFLKRWTHDPILNQSRIAEAYLVSRFADSVFVKQHIRFNLLNYPARVFVELGEAVTWLKLNIIH
ncbi:hypothetical protein [Marinoscillum sp.]|uniref:hypothetical protein n=1 Tax=Marinoscillum sp. TaxID=2024838 RepID=UPI003BA87B3C